MSEDLDMVGNPLAVGDVISFCLKACKSIGFGVVLECRRMHVYFQPIERSWHAGGKTYKKYGHRRELEYENVLLIHMPVDNVILV